VCDRERECVSVCVCESVCVGGGREKESVRMCVCMSVRETK